MHSPDARLLKIVVLGTTYLMYFLHVSRDPNNVDLKKAGQSVF